MTLKRITIMKFLLASLTLFPVALFAYLGQFSRMMSDDYCTIAIGQDLGVWDGMLYWFNSWAGSYSNFFFKSAIASLDTLAPRITPFITILVWYMGLVWLIWQILKHLQITSHRWFVSLVLTHIIIFTTLNALYSPQSFYWFAASTHYTLPLAVLTIYFALSMTILATVSWNTWSILGMILGGLICFISAGASEIFVAFQSALLTLFLTLIFGFIKPPSRNRYLLVYGVGWIATLFSLWIQFTSPGVRMRMAVEAEIIDRPLTSLSSIILETINLSFQYLSHAEAFLGFVILFLVTLLLSLRLYTPPAQTSESKTIFRIPSRFMIIWILVQLLYIPILWGHSSDTARILGRFSTGYFGVILIHAGFLVLGIFVLFKREWIEEQIQKRKYGWMGVLTVLGCIFLGLFMLTQGRNIHYRASNFLIMSAILLLVGFASLVSQTGTSKKSARASYLILASHLIVLILVGAITFTALFGRGFLTPRILSPVAYLLVLLGSVWGVYLGFLLKQTLILSSLPRGFQLLTTRLMLALIVVASLGIFVGQASLIPDLQTYVNDWDKQHQEILTLRESGQLNMEMYPLEVDLANIIQVTNLSQDPANRCALDYYDLESIEVKDGD